MSENVVPSELGYPADEGADPSVPSAYDAIAQTLPKKLATGAPSYDTLAQKIGSYHEQDIAAQTWLADNPDLPPQKAFDALHVAATTGVSPEQALVRGDELKRQAGQEAMALELSRNPILQRYLRDPSRLHVLKNDLENASWLTRYVTGQLEHGLKSVGYGILSTLDAAGIKNPLRSFAVPGTPLEGAIESMGPRAIDALDTSNEDPTAGMGTTAKVLSAPFRMAPYIAGAVATRAAGTLAGGGIGGYAAGAAFDISQTVGPLYQRLVKLTDENGRALLTEDQARALAWGFGVPTGLLTAGFGGASPSVKAVVGESSAQAVTAALKDVTVRAALARAGLHIAKDVGLGVAAMSAQAAANATAVQLGHAIGGEEPDFGQASQEVLHAAKQALIDLPALATFGAGYKFLQDRAVAVRSQQSKAYLTAMTDTAAGSEAVKKFPEVVQELIGKAKRENGAVQNTHVDLEAWNRYWQSKNLDPAAVASAVAGDSGAAYTEAQATGWVRVPIENWIARIAGSEHGPALMEDAKLYQDALTPRQAVEFEKQQQKLAQQAEKAEPDASRKLFEDFYSQAKTALVGTKVAPRRRDAVARATAELYASIVKTIAGREGWTIDETRARMGQVQVVPGERAPRQTKAPDAPPAPAAPPEIGKPRKTASEYTAERLAKVEALAAEGPKPSGWPWTQRAGGRVLVTEDASKPGRWRVTFVDENGTPTGHIEARTHKDALLEASRAGADFGALPVAPPAGTPLPEIQVAGTREGTIITPQKPRGERVRYEVVEASQLIPSHNPHTFGPHPDFPPGVQERNYTAQPEEQLKVIAGAARLNPAILLTDTPSPLDGPPIVTSGERKFVLGGNGRTMMIQRAFSDVASRETYKAALIQKASVFGLDPAQIEKMQAPVLVRELPGVSSKSQPPELVAAVRRFNEGMTQQLSPRARAIAEARTLSPATVESIGELLTGLDSGSLRDLMRDQPQEVISVLRRDGVINPQNQAQWLAGGELTPQAKDRIEGLFLGRIMENEDRLNATAPSLAQKIERIAPYLLRVEGQNPSLDETATVRKAIDILNDARSRNLPLGDLLAQASMFDKRDPAAVQLAKLLDAESGKILAARFKAWSHYAAVDPRQVTMFEGPRTAAGARGILLGENTLAQGAFHGSPHIFDQFSMQHIGTGQAAQVFGHGLYFAQNESVAKHYRDMLSDTTVTLRGVDLSKETKGSNGESWINSFLTRAANSYRDPDQVLEKSIGIARDAIEQNKVYIEKLRRDLAQPALEEPIRADRQKDLDAVLQDGKAFEEALTVLEAVSPQDVEIRRGALYSVDVPDAAELLDYDRPMSQQPESVKRVVASLLPKPTTVPISATLSDIRVAGASIGSFTDARARQLIESGEWADHIPWKGATFYHILSEKNGAQAASEALRKAGIPGLRYLDEHSRQPRTTLLFDGQPASSATWAFDTLTNHEREALQAFANQATRNPRATLDEIVAKGKDAFSHYPIDGGILDSVAKRLSLRQEPGTHNFVIWDDSKIRILDRFFQPVGNVEGQPIGFDSARGYISIGQGDGAPKFSIHLLEHADESTLAHELSHFFGEALGHLAQRTDSSAALKADYATLLKAMGYASHEERLRAGQARLALEASKTRTADEDATLRDLHAREEALANLWEQYLAGGEAPTEALKGVFSRFGRWMKGIYKSLGNIAQSFKSTYGRDLTLSDDVRGVFDRLLGSDAEIAAFNETDQARPSFKDIIEKAPEDVQPQMKARAAALNKAGLRQTAEAAIAGRPIGDLDPRYFLNAAARAKEAGKKEGMGPEEQFAAREQQYLSEALYRAARDARAEGEILRAKLQRFTTDNVRAKIGKTVTVEPDGSVTQPYLERVDELLGHFELREGVSRPAVGRRLLTADWLAREQAEGRDPVVPPSVLRNLDRQVHWKDLTLEEMRDLHDAVTSIAHQAELKRTILDKGKRRDRAEAVQELVTSALANVKEVPVYAQENTPRGIVQTAKQLAAKGGYALIRPENLIEQLDGGKLEGPWARLLFNPLKDGTNEWYKVLRESTKAIRDFIEALPSEDLRRLRETRFRINGQDFTAEAAFAVALNWGNDSNRFKLTQGWQHPSVGRRGIIPWGDGTPQEFLSRLTARDWEIVQGIWDTLSAKWQAISDLEKRLSGLPPKKVEPRAFDIETADGQIVHVKGGYYPVIYDPRFEGAGRTSQEASDLRSVLLFDRNYQRASTPQGYLEARAENYARPVSLQVFNRLPRKLSEQAKDLAMREALISAHSLLTDDNVSAALQRTVGTAGEKVLLGWLRDTANDLVAPDNGSNAWIEWMNRTRRGYIAAIFAYNIPQTLQNLTGMLPATKAVGPVWMSSAIAEMVANRKGTVEMIRAKSAEMRERSFSGHAEVGAALRELQEKRKLGEKFAEFGLTVWESTDKAVAYPTWLGAYRRAVAAVEDGGMGLPEEQAVLHANRTVRKYVMAGSTVDLPAIQRNKLARWFIPLYGWANNRFNQVYSALGDAKRADSTAKAVKIMGGTIAVLAAEQVLSEIATGKGPSDENDDGTIDARDWGRWLAKKALLTPTGWVPLVRQVAQAVDSGRDVQPSPEISVLQGGTKAVSGAVKLGYDLATGEQIDAQDWLDEAARISETVGYLKGMPVIQFRRTRKYLQAVQSGEEPVEGPVDAATGLIFGKRYPGSLREAIKE